jgi:dephospho-CoA kinase
MIFIIVGMPASGKNVARTYAESEDIPYSATGDIVRNEVRRRGIDPDPRNTSAVSTELRGEDGLGVTRLALASALESAKPVVFMEGMRSWPEIELIRSQSLCVVVAFISPRQVRLARIIFRGRPDDAPDDFGERDMREITYGTAVPIALADEYILNTGTIDDALRALDSIVRKYTVK